MKELIPEVSAVLDDLRHLKEIDDKSIDRKKLERHIEALDKLLDKMVTELCE